MYIRDLIKIKKSYLITKELRNKLIKDFLVQSKTVEAELCYDEDSISADIDLLHSYKEICDEALFLFFACRAKFSNEYWKHFDGVNFDNMHIKYIKMITDDWRKILFGYSYIGCARNQILDISYQVSNFNNSMKFYNQYDTNLQKDKSQEDVSHNLIQF